MRKEEIQAVRDYPAWHTSKIVKRIRQSIQTRRGTAPCANGVTKRTTKPRKNTILYQLQETSRKKGNKGEKNYKQSEKSI